MSEKILKALMQLFAIIANSDQLTKEDRSVVEAFLRQQVSQAHHDYYLNFFDEYLKFLQGKANSGKMTKRVSVNSVKILRICSDINSELDQKQKYVVLVKIVEFAYSYSEKIGDQELEFIETVASSFNIDKEACQLCLSFASSKNSSGLHDSPQILIVNNTSIKPEGKVKHILNETISGEICFLNIPDEGIIFVKYFGNLPLILNGQSMVKGRVYVFSQGAVIREAKIQPVYFSDVIRCFMDYSLTDDIHLVANMVDYYFSNGRKGLHAVSFSATSGNLIGIMGGSGAGKSTLLNILNGNLTPQSGEVVINGINIHTHRDQLQGIIGYIPQDDLLMEDLTVYQNLFYNSKLGLGNLKDEEIHKLVEQLLESLGLWAIRDLKVGDPLNKMVSGGQRKRLNIALELIRKPAVLFVDEPTSGLSSLDSENVMDLLKQLSLGGKLVFVVIHQPSSDIFKLFDKLMLLDTGGYPIYYGNPSDAIIYFKKRANLAAADESECETCGNINPEQIFSIIESKVFNEFGQATAERKITPDEWNHYYEEVRLPNVNTQQSSKPGYEGEYTKPSRLMQLKVFFTRDILSKLKNTQYLLINFLEAPVLAFILAYFLKYYKAGGEYIFKDNINVAAYIFMCVIVSLFMGLTVSAEEIIRDRKILKREEFLNLSRGSYLISKILALFIISAIQTFSFVFIGNTIFELHGMLTDYWLMLFTVSCFGNLLGLNISATFNSAVTIYILIPFLIIPQIILSGVMVKFENLNPNVTSQTQVPIIGEIMASRWAFEALAVNQYKNNDYQKNFFGVEKQLSEIIYRKDFWLIKLNDKLDSLHKGILQPEQIALLKNEIAEASSQYNSIPSSKAAGAIAITAPLSGASYATIKKYLEDLRKHFIDKYKTVRNKKDDIVIQISSKNKNPDYLNDLRSDYTNDYLSDLVTTTGDFVMIVEDGDHLVRRFKPVMMDGPDDSFIRAQFFVSRKNVFGTYFSTWSVNIAVIWLMSAVLMVTLYRNSFKNLLKWSDFLFDKSKFRKKAK
ncbi:MAG TPA: ATP-binding cassette domain-containing protein [Bacteroidia bacterium]|mgnify:CR=1 FL=1|nr:ATP-binding cassette domain-containing protein [Bacteroidia bacterium]